MPKRKSKMQLRKPTKRQKTSLIKSLPRRIRRRPSRILRRRPKKLKRKRKMRRRPSLLVNLKSPKPRRN